MAKIVMGYWDCTSCGKSVSGSLRTCPSCGHPRGAEVKFYMKDVEYLSAEEAEKIGTEPDWLCEYCGTYNNAKLTHCAGCTAVRGTGNKDYFDNNTDVERQKEKDETMWECAYCGARNPDSADHCGNCHAERAEKPKEEKKQEKPKKKAFWPFLLLFAAILIVGIIIARHNTKKIGATVTEITYTSYVHIEELTPVEKRAESLGDIPADGVFVREESEEYQETVKVGTHTEYRDNGNGTFTQIEVDDYDTVTKTRTVYVYTVDEWQDNKNPAKANGVGKDVTYAEVTLERGQRIGEKTVMFHVTIKPDDAEAKTYDCNKDEVINKIEVGGKYDFSIKDETSIISVK